MPAPRKISDEGLREVGETALARDRLLSDKELAIKHKVSLACIQQVMHRARKRGNVTVLLVSRGTDVANNGE